MQISSCSVLHRDKRSTQVKRPLEQLNLRHKTPCVHLHFCSLLVSTSHKSFLYKLHKAVQEIYIWTKVRIKKSNQGQVQVAWLGRVVIGRSELAKMWTCMYVCITLCKGGCQFFTESVCKEGYNPLPLLLDPKNFALDWEVTSPFAEDWKKCVWRMTVCFCKLPCQIAWYCIIFNAQKLAYMFRYFQNFGHPLRIQRMREW